MLNNLAVIVAGLIGAPLFILAAWRRPIIALTLWVTSSVVLAEYVLFSDSTSLHVHLTRLLLGGLLIGIWAGRSARQSDLPFPLNLEILMATFIAWEVISSCLTGTVSRPDTMKNLGILFEGFVIPVLVLYLARSIPHTFTTSRSACTILSFLLGYLILTAFLEHFHLDWFIFPRYILDPSVGLHSERARGPVINAAENGGIIAILIIFGLHQASYSFKGRLRWLMSLCLVLSGIPALWFTETRGPWLAFTAGLLVMLCHNRCRSVVLLFGAASVLSAAAAIYVVPSASNMVSTQLLPQRTDTDDTAEFRRDLYRESLVAFQERPIIGWGLGTFTSEDSLFQGFSRSSTLASGVQHDTIVAIATEAGLIGAILYISFIVTVALSLLKLRRTSRLLERKDFCVMCLAAFSVFVVNGMFADCRYFLPQNALVFLITGLGLAIRPNDRESKCLVPENNIRGY